MPMLSLASVDIFYLHIFHEDPIKKQARNDLDEGDTIDLMSKMGFVMAKYAELKDRKKMRELNEDDYLEWLDQFEHMEFLEALGDVGKTYNGQNVTYAEEKKKQRPTDRPVTTALFVLRAIQAGLTLDDLDYLEHGFIADMLTESANDNCKYQQLATQEDFDNF